MFPAIENSNFVSKMQRSKKGIKIYATSFCGTKLKTVKLLQNDDERSEVVTC